MFKTFSSLPNVRYTSSSILIILHVRHRIKKKKENFRKFSILVEFKPGSLRPTIGRHFNYRQAWQRTSLRPNIGLSPDKQRGWRIMEGKKKEEKRIACARACVCVCSDSNRYYLLFYSNETLAGSLCLPTSSLNPSLPRRVRWPHEYPDGLSRRTLDTRERFELDEASIYFRYFVFAAESGIFDSIQFRLIKRTRFIFTGPLFASEKERE